MADVREIVKEQHRLLAENECVHERNEELKMKFIKDSHKVWLKKIQLAHKELAGIRRGRRGPRAIAIEVEPAKEDGPEELNLGRGA